MVEERTDRDHDGRAESGVAVSLGPAGAITADQRVFCRGKHAKTTPTLGSRGLTLNPRCPPQAVETCALDGTQCRDLTGVTQLSGGPAHLCARTAGGEVYCWGANDHGQLGTGDTLRRAHATRALW